MDAHNTSTGPPLRTGQNLARAHSPSLAASEWAPCYCCGKSYGAENLVSFRCHPGDGICVLCAEWLYSCSRLIARRLHPIWQLPARLGRVAHDAVQGP
jgi:hypothetical protein